MPVTFNDIDSDALEAVALNCQDNGVPSTDYLLDKTNLLEGDLERYSKIVIPIFFSIKSSRRSWIEDWSQKGPTWLKWQSSRSYDSSSGSDGSGDRTRDHCWGKES